MNITDIRIRKIYEDNRLRALVSVTIDKDFTVHDIKVIQGPERLFAAMPSRKDENGVFRDIAHPITAAARIQLENAVLERFMLHAAQAEAEKTAMAIQRAAEEKIAAEMQRAAQDAESEAGEKSRYTCNEATQSQQIS